MNIHKTHNKGDLRLLFKSLQVYINPRLTKREIIENMNDYIPLITYTNLIPN